MTKWQQTEVLPLGRSFHNKRTCTYVETNKYYSLMVAGRIQETKKKKPNKKNKWTRSSPAGSDNTALKSTTAEEPDGEQAFKKSQVLSQIQNLVQSCHSYGSVFPLFPPPRLQFNRCERQRIQSCWIGALSHRAIGHSQLHSSWATFINFVLGLKVYIACHSAVNLLQQSQDPAGACW